MVTKSQGKSTKKGKVKVGKLKLKKKRSKICPPQIRKKSGADWESGTLLLMTPV